MDDTKLSQLPSLADWRRTVAELYAAVRRSDNHVGAWDKFINGRNELFKEHSQTPLTAEQRRGFSGLNYYPYDWRLRMNGRLKFDVDPEIFTVELANDGPLRCQRVASVHFRLAGKPRRLSLYWLLGYGGGLFLPFTDATNGEETYGGGRYLYDTIKGADLGVYHHSILLDFNYAYNPSCAYNSLWSCPLPPAENKLPVEVEAGEKLFITEN